MNATATSTTPSTSSTARMPSTNGSFDFFFGPAAAKGLTCWACAAPGNCGNGVDGGGNGADVAIGPEPVCGGGCVGNVPEFGADVSGGGGGGSTGVKSCVIRPRGPVVPPLAGGGCPIVVL